LSRWRLVCQFNLKLKLLKDDIKQSIEGKYRKKIEDSQKNKDHKENENLKVKNEIRKNQEIEANLNTKVKEFEDKEFLIMQTIHKLENEKKLIEEEIMIFSTEKEFLTRKEKALKSDKENNKDKEKDFSLSLDKILGSNGDLKINSINNNTGCDNIKGRIGSYANGRGNNNFKGKKEVLLGLEKKISEFERKINKITDANSTKDSEINLYMQQMNEIVSKHERTSNFIKLKIILRNNLCCLFPF